MSGIRDFVVLFIIIGLIPVSLKRPWHGILGWYWIAYMVPHGLAWGKWDRVSKILLMTFVTMCLFQDRVRLRWLYMVPALGLGFYGVKGALWVLRTGGGGTGAEEGYRVFGPDMSFFADANNIGPALCMILPILLYLSRDEERPWLKRILRLAFPLSIISIIFTFSRGAFLGLAVVLTVL